MSALRVTRKSVVPRDLHAGEERVEVGGDHLLQRDAAARASTSTQAGQHARAP